MSKLTQSITGILLGATVALTALNARADDADKKPADPTHTEQGIGMQYANDSGLDGLARTDLLGYMPLGSSLPTLPGLDDMKTPQAGDEPLIVQPKMRTRTLPGSWDLELMPVFMFAPQFYRSPNLEKRLDITRDEFEPTMGKEFRDQLEVSRMFAALGLEATAITPWHIFSLDMIGLKLSGFYSSSALFGKIKDIRNYEPMLMGAIPVGTTETEWTQDLNNYVSLLFGAEYGIDFLKRSSFRMGASADANVGFSYMDFETLLRMFVIPTDLFDEYGYENLAAINVYRDRSTVAKGSGFGLLSRFGARLNLEWYDVALSLGGGFQVEDFPCFNVTENQISGGVPNTADVLASQSYSIDDYTRNGWFVLFGLGYRLPLFSTKEIETERGTKNLYVPAHLMPGE